MKRIEISLLLALVFCAAVSFFSFDGQCAEIRENVLRLHVIANSDTLSDQELKLQVRDRILSDASPLFSDCETLEQALDAAEASLDSIEAIAADEIARRGYDYSVHVSVDRSYFSTRTYGTATLPAGMYDALKIEIGKAEGRNWWCVMFPMLCSTGVADDSALETVLDENQLCIVRAQGYDVKFKCVEWYEELLSRLGVSS